jgi:hypothetical protein
MLATRLPALLALLKPVEGFGIRQQTQKLSATRRSRMFRVGCCRFIRSVPQVAIFLHILKFASIFGMIKKTMRGLYKSAQSDIAAGLIGRIFI